MADVSIIITTENSAENIDALLLSLFVQSVQTTEIILVDNASTDDTLKLLDRYKKFDNRVQVIKKKTKNATEKLIKSGVKRASAPYIYIMDGTKFMYIGQGCLQRLLDNIRKYGSDFVYAPCGVINALTFETLPMYQIQPEKFVQQPVFQAEDIPSDMLFRMYLSPYGKLFNAEFLRKCAFAPANEAFFLDCLFKAQKISFDLHNTCVCHVLPKNLWRPHNLAEQREKLKILKKYHAFERYKNAYIYHKMRAAWLGIMQAPSAERQTMFTAMKEAFADEDFSKYDFNVLRTQDLYWAVQNALKLSWDEFAETYIGRAA